MEYPDAPGPAGPPFGLSFRKGTIMQIRFIPAASALALAVSAAMPAHAQQATQAELYLDVATHAMPGTGTGMGAMGRLAGVMGGGTASYGTARHPGMPGKYLDVALHNRRQPGATASQAVPKGLGLGEQIQLLAPERKSSTGGKDTGHDSSGQQQDGSYKIRYYWGCGEQVRAGQPAEFTLTVRNGKPVTSGRAMKPRQVPSHGIDAGPQYALWPNPGARKTVGAKGTLVGEHHLTGNALPETMRFELDRNHDFLPELKLKSEGDAKKGMTLHWDGVDGASAYFAHATVMDGDTMVMWSSSEDGYAGPELFDYLPDSLVAQWRDKRTLLGSDASSCRIPKGVLADGAAPMVQMIAYGDERSLAQPRPTGAPRDWHPAWNVRVRNKSTAMLMPGGIGAAVSPKEVAKPAAKEAAKSLLRGLLGR